MIQPDPREQLEDPQAARALRIGMISYYLPSGSKIGVGYQVHALANALARRGHQVTVFSGCPASAGSLYETVQVPLRGANRIFKFAWSMRRVDWTQFDVLHAHGDDYWLAGRPRPLHIRTMHGSCLSEMLHIRGAKEKLRMGLLGLGELVAIAVSDVCVGVSHNTYGRLHVIRRHIANGVDLSRFHPGEKSEVPSILFVGTYGMRKRGRLLAEAFASTVRPAVPDAELWMVCQDAPEAESVRVLGRVSDAELAQLYAAAWVFCLPSSYEGFGIPYIEAMASGTPVVATPNPGAREVTEDGAVGVLTSEADLGTSLLRLIQSDRDRSALAARASAAAQKYDLRRVAREYEDLYLTHRPRRALPAG
jgi:glycosyltransferase involved in cell wall biosynthesis